MKNWRAYRPLKPYHVFSLISYMTPPVGAVRLDVRDQMAWSIISDINQDQENRVIRHIATLPLITEGPNGPEPQ
jgi:hypothetical protein